MIRSCRCFILLSWNVRGLGQDDKCVAVRDNIAKCHPQLACLQETKLNTINDHCVRSFLASSRLTLTVDAYHATPADGSRGGLLTAWCSTLFTMTGHFSFDFTSTVFLHSTTSDLRFAVTNVYGPSDHSFTDIFLVELINVAGTISDPWILIGDFNLSRARSDKNTPSFNSSLATRFNHAIDALQVIELPLLDQLFTWTNKRATPTLARLDRAFINIAFSDAFPGTTLHSGNRPTSDHTPLHASIQTNIPKPKSFRLERSWLLDPSYLPSVTLAW